MLDQRTRYNTNGWIPRPWILESPRPDLPSQPSTCDSQSRCSRSLSPPSSLPVCFRRPAQPSAAPSSTLRGSSLHAARLLTGRSEHHVSAQSMVPLVQCNGEIDGVEGIPAMQFGVENPTWGCNAGPPFNRQGCCQSIVSAAQQETIPEWNMLMTVPELHQSKHRHVHLPLFAVNRPMRVGEPVGGRGSSREGRDGWTTSYCRNM